MAVWEAYLGCMEAKSTQAGQVARDIGTKAFADAGDTAIAFVKAAVSWWDGMDTQVRRAVTVGLSIGGVAGGILVTRLAAVVIDAAGLELLAGAGAQVAAGLAALAVGAAVGAFLTASAMCLAA
jgi:hypothetical protein